MLFGFPSFLCESFRSSSFEWRGVRHDAMQKKWQFSLVFFSFSLEVDLAKSRLNVVPHTEGLCCSLLVTFTISQVPQTVLCNDEKSSKTERAKVSPLHKFHYRSYSFPPPQRYSNRKSDERASASNVIRDGHKSRNLALSPSRNSLDVLGRKSM